ncbi:MAG: class I SAM-dependent methyltransferase [Alphaproteobacteria bacterium]|nr:class I SAM-dependent methyltransferase [Alphaproteobacteria bacterium]
MDRVARHYARGGIAPRILAALRAAGIDQVTPETLAPLDQFHARGVDATRDLIAALGASAGEQVLDIGCGIGGPARMLAAESGAGVTGLDLTQDYCAAARTLNHAAGLGDRVTVVRGDALALPFADGTFDAATCQYVAMNIADKALLYAEARRVLRPGGAFALSGFAAGSAGAPTYPTPWAETAATSFLATPAATRAELLAAGFAIARFHDATPALLATHAALRKRLRAEGPPALGLHVMLGDRIREQQRNSARAVDEGRLIALEVLCRKPRF